MKKKRKNLIKKIVSIISLILSIIFIYLLNKLGMIPTKFLALIYIFYLLIYFFNLFLIFKKNIKRKFKIISTIILILFAVISGIGIKYLSKTINFFEVISSEIQQKEIYYVMVLKDSNYTTINDLKDKKIGIYSTKNIDKVESTLSEKVSFKKETYTAVSNLIESINNKSVNAVVINSAIKSMLDDGDLKSENKLVELYKIEIFVENNDSKKEVDVTNSVFNIYIAGGDSYGSIENVTNTDVNMVATVDPINKKILLTSIPRDYYVVLPSFGNNAYDKLTHAGYYGIEESIGAVENLLDIDINYYIKVNFSTVENVVDAIDGIDVYSDYDFYEEAFYEYHFKKGNNHLNGRQALAFARERHSFPDGDVQRVKNQQKVITAIINKFTSSTTLVTNYSKILDSISECFNTNIDTKSINKLIKMQLNDMTSWTIESQNLTGFDSYTTNCYSFQGLNLYVMKQDEETVNKAKLKINDYLLSNE